MRLNARSRRGLFSFQQTRISHFSRRIARIRVHRGIGTEANARCAEDRALRRWPFWRVTCLCAPVLDSHNTIARVLRGREGEKERKEGGGKRRERDGPCVPSRRVSRSHSVQLIACPSAGGEARGVVYAIGRKAWPASVPPDGKHWIHRGVRFAAALGGAMHHGNNLRQAHAQISLQLEPERKWRQLSFWRKLLALMSTNLQ